MPATQALSPLDAVNEFRNNNNGQVVLVLQGGGALGAYQGGVYQAMHEAGVEPDWLIGTSIGAINASIIAGNRVEDRLAKLQEFWRRVQRNGAWGAFPAWKGIADSLASWTTLTTGIPGFFETNPRAFLGGQVPLGVDHAGFYSTEPLRKTLEELVDFSLVNQDHPRLTVGAAHLRTSMMHYFDSKEMELAPDHVMASGALPPGFPPIEIDGEHYWDGGLVSNTPLDYVLDQERDRDLLIFQIDLFPSRGPLPTTLLEAAEREKDIRYSSRTRMNTDANMKLHNTRKAIRAFLKRLPAEYQADPAVQKLCDDAKENTVSVVHLIYRTKNFESSSKDYDFSRAGMIEHWKGGERDVHHSMRHPEWLERPQNGETMVTYDLTRDELDATGQPTKAIHE